MLTISPGDTVPPDSTQQTNRTRRRDRYASREALWSISELDRVRNCGRRRINAAAGVPLHLAGDTAHFSNLQLCGSIWACPVCSAKIRNGRADEIRRGLESHLAAGGTALLVTLTVRHHRHHRLKDVQAVVVDGWREMLSGRAWQAAKRDHGVIGTIRSLEITHGENGWHPHLHVLVLIEPRLLDTTDGLRRYLEDRWLRLAERRGFASLAGVAVDVQRVESGSEVASYVAKVQDPEAAGGIALEVARHDLKEGRRRSRTPFAILRDFRETGDMVDLMLWLEYEAATKGRQAIAWSAGLRAALGVDEVSDQDLAEESPGGGIVGVVPASTWRKVIRKRGLSHRLLLAAEAGGYELVRQVLVDVGGELLPPPDPPG